MFRTRRARRFVNYHYLCRRAEMTAVMRERRFGWANVFTRPTVDALVVGAARVAFERTPFVPTRLAT